jgi:flagellar biosynthesis/type III secretory pathway chaperone
VVPCPQDQQVPKSPVTPVTSKSPITPVTIDLLTSLHTLIKQETHALETSKQRIQRHIQKLASAAQISLAKEALLQDENKFLCEINKEAKVRRATKSLVIGTAKVMSEKDLTEA